MVYRNIILILVLVLAKAATAQTVDTIVLGYSPGAIFIPLSVTGSGPYNVSATVRDVSSLNPYPADSVAVGDWVTSLSGGVGSFVATFRVTSVLGRSGSTVQVQLEGVNDPAPFFFPTSTATISRPINARFISLVEGEPDVIRVAKVNHFLRTVDSIGTYTNGGGTVPGGGTTIGGTGSTGSLVLADADGNPIFSPDVIYKNGLFVNATDTFATQSWVRSKLTSLYSYDATSATSSVPIPTSVDTGEPAFVMFRGLQYEVRYGPAVGSPRFRIQGTTLYITPPLDVGERIILKYIK
jgi:hypothetical protein